jgi:hypothetical protein
MTELAEGPAGAGVRRSLAYWNQEFQRIHPPILRYGFAVVSVAIALGMGIACNCSPRPGERVAGSFG